METENENTSKLHLSKSVNHEKTDSPWTREVNGTYIRRSEDIQTSSKSFMYNQIMPCVQRVDQKTFICSKLTIKPPKKGVKYIRS